jgi:hypothetical protein
VYHVVLESLCHCARKHGTERIRSCETREEAELLAHEWADHLNNSFCGRHGFDVVEVEEHYVIAVEQGGFVEACEL